MCLIAEIIVANIAPPEVKCARIRRLWRASCSPTAHGLQDGRRIVQGFVPSAGSFPFHWPPRGWPIPRAMRSRHAHNATYHSPPKA